MFIRYFNLGEIMYCRVCKSIAVKIDQIKDNLLDVTNYYDNFKYENERGGENKYRCI